jgi:hypothetical protein
MSGGKGGILPAEQQIGDLHLAIGAFCERDKVGRSGRVLAAELVELRHACDRLELEFSETAADFAATDEYEVQGSITPIDWIRHNCQMSGHAAAERVCVGELTDSLPQSTDALCQGQIGFAHLALLARTARGLSESDTAQSFDETALLAQAREMSVGRFRHICHHARHADDPEQYVADEVHGVESRVLAMCPFEDGAVSVRGLLDAAGGAALRTALEPLARPSGADDDRHRDRRLADALVELAIHALDTGAVPQRASQRAHLQVTTSLETLLAWQGAPAAELEFSMPISARMVQRLACDATVTRVLLDADTAVVDVGRARRVVSGSTRRALNVRDRCCQWPGCERPASWSAAHHVVHWCRGGRTDLSNLVLLCHRHHWMVHEGGWQVARDHAGSILTVPPPTHLYRTQLPRGPDQLAA